MGPDPADIAALLVDALQEEYKAHTLYRSVLEDFAPSALPFAAIAESEARHVEALQMLFTRRQMAPPASVWTRGELRPLRLDPALACAGGVKAETEDADFYAPYLSRTDLPQDVRNVFTNLQRRLAREPPPGLRALPVGDTMTRNAPARFHWRAFVTLYVTLSFLLLAVSGIVLFVAPPGRVANWSRWTLGALDRHGWQSVHTVVALVFVLAGALHLWFNWRTFWFYLRSKLAQGLLAKRELALATAAVAAVAGLTLADLPPFGSVMDLGDRAKESWSSGGGEPPVPHAELLTLERLAATTQIPLDRVLSNLDAAGVNGVEPAGHPRRPRLRERPHPCSRSGSSSRAGRSRRRSWPGAATAASPWARSARSSRSRIDGGPRPPARQGDRSVRGLADEGAGRAPRQAPARRRRDPRRRVMV